MVIVIPSLVIKFLGDANKDINGEDHPLRVAFLRRGVPVLAAFRTDCREAF